jgi:ATP-dependent helicase/nuclease subunit A
MGSQKSGGAKLMSLTMELDARAPLDSLEREKIVCELDSNMIVLAGAGTGKTKLLIDRIVGLILEKKIPVERIVALTFTKKAAEEMRIRLERKLQGLLSESKLTDEKLNLASRALMEIPKSQIGTIHGFASHLLHLYPVQSGVDPKFREDDGSVSEELFEKEWFRWISEEWGPASKRQKFWNELLKKVDLFDLKDLAFGLLSPHYDIKSIKDSVAIDKVLEKWKIEFNDLASMFPKETGTTLFYKSLDELTKIISDFPRLPGENDWAHLLRGFDRPPADWEETLPSLKIWKRRVINLSNLNEKLLLSVLKGLAPIISHVQRELNRRGYIGFDGLLVSAREES